jgi:hypothetical protein
MLLFYILSFYPKRSELSKVFYTKFPPLSSPMSHFYQLFVELSHTLHSFILKTSDVCQSPLLYSYIYHDVYCIKQDILSLLKKKPTCQYALFIEHLKIIQDQLCTLSILMSLYSYTSSFYNIFKLLEQKIYLYRSFIQHQQTLLVPNVLKSFWSEKLHYFQN